MNRLKVYEEAEVSRTKLVDFYTSHRHRFPPDLWSEFNAVMDRERDLMVKSEASRTRIDELLLQLARYLKDDA